MTSTITRQQSASTKRGSAVIAGIVAGASYGIGGAVSQIVKQQGFEIAHIVVAQFVASIIILGILVAIRYRSSISFREIVMLVLVGAISTVSSYTYYIAIDLLSVGQAVALQFQYVWMAIVITAIAERTRPSAPVIFSCILVMAGTFMGSGMADELLAGKTQMDPLGIVLALICALFYAIFIFANGKLAVDHPPITRAFYMVIGGLAVSLAALPFMSAGSCDVVGIIPGGIAMGLIMSIIPVVCIATSASKLSSGLVAILTSSELPMAVIAGCVLFGETVTPLSIAGVVIICISIVLSEIGNLRH